MNNLIFYLFFLITTISLGQIKFERSGYFINNKNLKNGKVWMAYQECTVEIQPQNIEYKLNETGKFIKFNFSNQRIKEALINPTISTQSKYIRGTVNIDQSNSSEQITYLKLCKQYYLGQIKL